MSSISGKYHSNISEVRPNTKGALYDEIQRSEQIHEARQSSPEKTGYLRMGVYKYDHENKTEALFRFKSRGKLREKPEEILGIVTFKNDLVFKETNNKVMGSSNETWTFRQSIFLQ